MCKNCSTNRRTPSFSIPRRIFFLAKRDGQTVGRIAAILNNNHNRFHNEKVAFFGFFESINDRTVGDALLNHAAVWGRERGMVILRGPMNYSTNDTCGLLIEGFDKLPCILMPIIRRITSNCWSITSSARPWICMPGGETTRLA